MSDSVRIRIARAGDAAALRAIYAPHVEGAAVSFETEVPAAAVLAQRIEKLLPTHPWLVATIVEDIGGDAIAGYAYAGPHRERAAYRWSVEVTTYVDARFQRRRIGRSLYEALFALLELQNVVNAFGIITLPNAASVALHESCGFTRCATLLRAGYKFGAWHDVGWWQKQFHTRDLGPRDLAPVEFVPFSKLSLQSVKEVLAR